MSTEKELKQLLNKLEELKDKMEDDDNAPSISDLSLKIEHQKHDLSNIIECKRNYLILINMALSIESNIYSFAGGVITKKYSIKQGLKDIKESFDNLLEGLEMIGNKLLDNSCKCEE